MVHQVSLRSRMVRLRPIADGDAQLLASWRNDPTSLHLWATRRALIPEEAATAEVWHDLDADKHVWLIAENSKGDIVGMTYSCDPQFVDEHCFVTTFVAESHRNHGYGAEIAALFLDYLFTYFNFRKVYYEVYGYNSESIKPIVNFGFVEEGRFPEHRYHDGEWHELIRYAVYRKDLDRIRAFLARHKPSQSAS